MHATTNHVAQHCLFDTAIGPCGIAWSARGVTRLVLPDADRSATEARLGASPNGGATPPPEAVATIIADVQRFLNGSRVDFNGVVLDLNGVTPFHQRVYDAARRLKWGETVSYGELAQRAGSPGAARAVGQALSRNPVAIIIPCHRILARGNALGGFTAFGGASAKQLLLGLEGVHPGTPAPDGPVLHRRGAHRAP